MTKAIVESTMNRMMHRLLADGVHYRDALDICAATPNWESWCDCWSRWAADGEKRGDIALAKGAKLTAADEYARAAVYYHYAQTLLYHDLAKKEATHARKVAAFNRAAPLFDPPIELVSIPFEGIGLAGHFRVPHGVKSPPCVILMGGLDTTKEDYIIVNNYCIERGLATLAFDGPGQGETQFKMRWRQDNYRAVSAVIDYLEKRPEIDSGRVGVCGRSMGGHYAPRAAAVDERIKAVVSWGAMYHLKDLSKIPEHVVQGLMYVSGTKSMIEAQTFFECLNLEGYAEKITCPLLVIHGGRDRITPMDHATRLIKETRGKVEALIWEDSIHCCHDRSHIVRPAIADFMGANL
ncbi:MAG TPA: alpha/beta hydrolase [Bryobacteraceae bacterium]|nr:alpha/beta hydrolase [Bryobacteraceae bacterium]